MSGDPQRNGSKLGRFASQYHRPSAPTLPGNGLSSLRPGVAPPRNSRHARFSITANPYTDAAGSGPVYLPGSDIPLQTMTSYPGDLGPEEDIAESGNMFTRTWKSLRKSLRMSTAKRGARRQPRHSLEDTQISYPGGPEDLDQYGDSSTSNTPQPVFEDQILNGRVSQGADSPYRPAEEPDSCAVLAKWIVGFVLFSAVLVFATFSKVCFVAIASKYNDSLVSTARNDSGLGETQYRKSLQDNSITFVQLVTILLAPQLFTAVRMLFSGIIGKSSTTYPWPSGIAVAVGITVSLVEAAALCGFVFLVAPHVGPPAAILLLSGVYVFTGLLGIRGCCCRAVNDDDDPLRAHQNRDEGILAKRIRRCWNGSAVNFLGASVQIIGLLGALAVACYLEFAADPSDGVFYLESKRWRSVLRLCITVVLIPLVLSVIWSRPIQKLIHQASPPPSHLTSLSGYDSLRSERTLQSHKKSSFLRASRRGGFLYALVRLVAIPFLAYGFTHAGGVSVDIPLGFSGWSGLDIAVLLLQILSSLTAFLVGLVGLWTTLQTWAFTLPLLLSTPLAVAWYWLAQVDAVDIFPFYKDTHYLLPYQSLYLQAATAALALLWLGQLLVLGYRIWRRPRFALARERSLFLVPHLDSVFMESYLLLNRHSAQMSFCTTSPSGCLRDTSKKPVIFICSTMYREAEHEMKQMLTSINRVAQAIKENRGQYAIHDHRKPHFESHIFFDGSIGKNEHFNDFVLQLMSLLEETLGVKLNDVQKIKTPYGYQMRWQVGELPFCVHLKDNSKVKNKKRWSQVMYMSYVLKYRMNDLNDLGRYAYDPQYSYILTTDADIEFTAEAVKALLDFLARDDSVGAVCARTHPLGSGPLVWYQIFEYAFGHWFQKSAEHVLGCVLCCPGCFSVFRVSAIADVLETYQSNVTTASEFLTKDMGEDRWLCTLMVEKGWRLEYAALSQDSTYCPEDFNEFFNQRRRWVPSTVANLLQMIVSAPKMAANNDSISYLFIAYQLIIIVSTAVSPATVILIVASGLFSAYGYNVNIIVGILSAITILFGIICVVFPERIQLNVAKFLTVVSGIVMILAFVGIFSGTIRFLVPEPGSNSTLAERATDPNTGVSVDSVYLWGFAAVVIAAGILNFSEILVLLHFIWYILAIPSAYLLLLIYSAANLHVRSWGTRVGATAKPAKQDQSLYDTWKNRLVDWGQSAAGFIKSKIKRKVSKDSPQDGPAREETKSTAAPPVQDERFVKSTETASKPMEEEVLRWLDDLECKEFTEKFQSNGYTSMEFISFVKREDLVRIGVRTQGHTRRLEKAVRALPAPAFLSQKKVAESVQEFLDTLNLGQYSDLFYRNGYFLKSDVDHLLELSADDLKAMGILPAHVKIIIAGLQHMRNPTCYEIKISQTRKTMEKAGQQGLNDVEREFWQGMATGVLKAEPAIANDKTDDLKSKLYGLRNSVLLAMLVVNVIWMVLLLTLDLTFFESLGISNSLLPIAFSVLYFGVIAIQFAALVVHRIETLAQYIARANIK